MLANIRLHTIILVAFLSCYSCAAKNYYGSAYSMSSAGNPSSSFSLWNRASVAVASSKGVYPGRGMSTARTFTKGTKEPFGGVVQGWYSFVIAGEKVVGSTHLCTSNGKKLSDDDLDACHANLFSDTYNLGTQLFTEPNADVTIENIEPSVCSQKLGITCVCARFRWRLKNGDSYIGVAYLEPDSGRPLEVELTPSKSKKFLGLLACDALAHISWSDLSDIGMVQRKIAFDFHTNVLGKEFIVREEVIFSDFSKKEF